MAYCSVAECDRPARIFGLCSMHGRRKDAQQDSRFRADPIPPCLVEDCDRPARGRGMCTKHYQRWKAHGDPMIASIPRDPRLCTVENCDKPRGTSATLCEMHRGRQRRHGDVETVLKDHTPAVERWKTCYQVDPVTQCWNWIGRIRSGYGLISNGATYSSIPAHRFVYEQMVGPVPEGLELDHLCRNRRCVNPIHLEPVEHPENIDRGHKPTVNSLAYCQSGHQIIVGTACRACAANACAATRLRT